MPSLWLGLRATAIYAAFLAAATLYVFQLSSPPAGLIQSLAALLPFQFLAALYCVSVALRGFGWQAVGFGRLRWSALIWFLPAWIVLLAMVWSIAKAASLHDFMALGAVSLTLLIVTPFLIAFAEELLFRGILLRGAMATVPLIYAMLISAVLFGAIHTISAISGQGLSGTTQQMFFAISVGFFLAPIAVKLGNLWPLIIWHWLWNLAVYASQLAEVWHPFVLIGIGMQTVICIWLWTDMLRGRIAG